MCAHLPETPQRRAEAKRAQRISTRHRPVKGSPEVVLVKLETVEPLPLLGAEQIWCRRHGQRQVGCGMRVTDRIRLACFLEAFGGEFPNHLQHEQSRLDKIREPAQQALDCQLVESCQNVDAKLSRRPAHCLCLFEVGAAREYREAAEQALQRLLQEVVAPCDRTVERLLATRQVASPSSEDAHACLQPRQQRLRVEELYPRRGELDCKR